MVNKIFIAIITMCLASIVTAQDTISKKGFTAETQFNLVNLPTDKFVPNLKIRYFVSNEIAIRSTFDLSANKTVHEINEIDGTGVGTVEKNYLLFTGSIGIEKHFKSKELANTKVSPYMGAELKISTGHNDEYGSRTDSVTFIPNYNYSSKVPLSGFGVHVFTGVDYTLFDNLYIGTEIGFSYQKITQNRGEFNTKDASSLTASDVTTAIPSIQTTNLNLINFGIVRVGWRF